MYRNLHNRFVFCVFFEPKRFCNDLRTLREHISKLSLRAEVESSWTYKERVPIISEDLRGFRVPHPSRHFCLSHYLKFRVVSGRPAGGLSKGVKLDCNT